MKTYIIILSMFFVALSLDAQKPAIKFYLDDGSFKSYLISTLDSLSVSKSDSKYVMHIYYQDTNIAYYPNEIIQSVKIEKDTNRQLYLNVYIFGYPKPYLVFDIDSIVFKIDKWQPLTIGTQVWMLKNLDVDHYRNGDSIPEVRDSLEWPKLRTGAWCNYNNSDSLGKIYGKLYNWFAVDDPGGLAPTGWHIPSNAEFVILSKYLGTDSVSGGKLKDASTVLWMEPNVGATNESGFSALPGGLRGLGFDGCLFRYIGSHCFFWLDTETDNFQAWSRMLINSDATLKWSSGPKDYGKSVRCVKD